jgi:5-methyltetrahydrofolate--homocysteine methyltransferase
MNAAFITAAIGAGMTSAIINPCHSEIIQAVRGADVMMGNDPECANWIRAYRDAASEAGRRSTGRRNKQQA